MKQWSPSRQGTGMDERLNHKGEVLGVRRAALEMGMIHFHPQSLQIPVHIYIPISRILHAAHANTCADLASAPAS